MPDFSKEQSKKVQVGSKEGKFTILKPSSFEDSGRPNLGAFRILANR
jgi:hypothetical protein